MDMTNQEYGRYVSQKAKPSPLWKNLLITTFPCG